MTTLAFPTLSRNAPTEINDWSLQANTFVHESPPVGSIATIALPGALWGFTFTYRMLSLADRSILAGWLAKLGGRNGRFYCSHPSYRVPRGTARGTGTCLAAAQFATALTITGLGANVTLLAGDFIEVGTALLVQVTDDAVADGTGQITVNIAPMLRAAVAGGASAALAAPRAQFRLLEDKQGIATTTPGAAGLAYGEFVLQGIEAF